jgi:hypothetical protein
MSCQYHTREENKEKSVGDLLSLHREYSPITRKSSLRQF